MSKFLAKAQTLADRFPNDKEIMKQAIQKQVKWDNKKKEHYVVEKLDDNTLLVRPLNQQDMEEGGYN